MKKQLVSVVIPVYNARPYILEAVHSALRQTHRETEVIVIDDGSTDGTADVLKPLVASRSIRYVFEENKGLSAARNRGVREARGNYVAFLDSDDVCLPDRIELQLRALEVNKSFDICYSDLLHFTDTQPRSFFHHRYYSLYQSGNLLRELLKRQFINPSTVFARREVFDRYGFFDESLKRSEDWDMWLRWSKAGLQFYFLNKILVQYRIRMSANLTSLESEPLMREANLALFSKFFSDLDVFERADFDEKRIFKALEEKAALAYLMVGDAKNALKHMARAREYHRGSVLLVLLSLVVRVVPPRILRSFIVFLRSAKRRMLLSHLRVPESFAFRERYADS